MIQTKFLLSVSIALLIGQHQVLTQESLPPGKHKIYVEKGPWGTGGLCKYIYGVDEGKYNPVVASFEFCDHYSKDQSDWSFITNKPGEIEVRSPCSGLEYEVVKQTGKGKFSNGSPTEIYQGDICVKS